MPAKEFPLLGRRLDTGAMVGEYQVTDVLEEGGMGRIYAAVHPLIGKQVAIKVLAAFLSNDETMTQRFIQEARAVNQIKHANIVDIFGFGRLPDGRLYYIMELLAGRSLKARRAEDRPLRYEETLSILAQVCDALAAAHAEGIVHRDLKPDNIFLVTGTDLRTVKLLDFGIAKLIHTGATDNKTEAGLLMGTPRYMSPEQCMSREVDGRADIYSLGVIMFELFTGKLPFEGASSIEMINAHLSQPPPVPRDLAPIPQELNELILACLAKEPDQRPTTVVEVRERLLEISISQALGLDAGLPVAIAEAVTPAPAQADVTPVPAPAGPTPPAPAAAPSRPRLRPVHYAVGLVVLGFAAFGVYMAVDRLLGDRPAPAASATGLALQIVSEPPGATVILDGERQALLTPYAFPLSPRAEVRVRVELPGHQPHEQTVRFAAGEPEQALRVVLAPLEEADAGPVAAAPAPGRDERRPAGSAPVIAQLRLRSSVALAGQRTTISADVDFTDADGDVHAVIAQVVSSSRSARPQRTRVNLRQVTSGTVAFTFVVTPGKLEPHHVEVRLVDDAGQASNRLEAAIEVRDAELPAPDTAGADAGSPVTAPMHP